MEILLNKCKYLAIHIGFHCHYSQSPAEDLLAVGTHTSAWMSISQQCVVTFGQLSGDLQLAGWRVACQPWGILTFKRGLPTLQTPLPQPLDLSSPWEPGVCVR